MNQTADGLVTAVLHEDIRFEPIDAEGESATIAGVINPISTTMGGGLCRLKRSSFEWTVHYDELIYVVSGSLYILHNNEKVTAEKGEMILLKDGANIVYGTDDDVEFFFSIYPVNWREMV